MINNDIDIKSVLEFINPAECNYTEWVNIGMALKDSGYNVELWENWSRRDSARYHDGECLKKWDSFNGSSLPVTIATIIQMAAENGWHSGGDYCIGWDDEIGGKHDDLVILDQNWIEGQEITEPQKWNPVKEITTYLKIIFEAGENVGYVTESWKSDDGKYLPTKGSCSRTAGELIEALNKCGGDVGAALGDYKKEAGAWIRFNPLDGKGVKNENVTEFRYALVESDSTEIEKQNAIIRNLELPVACLVYSGGKSIHAIVRVDAANYDEYRKRVDYLYNVCQKNGLVIDRQNRNPSRLSRLPGIERGNKKQFILDTNIGKSSFNEWKEWIESVNDDLPDPESIADVWDNLPELSPPLIDGVLRQGHKMLLAGPSKAGKSFSLIELCCAFAEGRGWMGFPCTQGKVLYVNLELDRASCLHRFRDVYTALKWAPDHLKNIDIWNLRGKSIPMDKLAPKLIRRAAKKNYIAVIIDPIYKIITGDENSADQMAAFCNQFDKVCNELSCAVIYCHHHSKGSQGNKRSMDRASGSGVFARDPDALLDLIELEVSEQLKEQEQNKLICSVCQEWLSRFHVEDIPTTKDATLELAREKFSKPTLDLMYGDISEKIKKQEQRTAWRIEGTLREFPKFTPVNVWFDYPVHILDESLKDLDADGQKAFWQKGNKARKERAENQRNQTKENLINAIENCNMGSPVTVKDVAEYMGAKEDTVSKWIKKFHYYIDKNTHYIEKEK